MRTDEINVFNIMEIFQGPFELTEHVFKGKTCPYMDMCIVRQELDKAGEELAGRLRSISIRWIIDNNGNIWGDNDGRR
jgi:DNA-binding IscR family transcriptional regulator